MLRLWFFAIESTSWRHYWRNKKGSAVWEIKAEQKTKFTLSYTTFEMQIWNAEKNKTKNSTCGAYFNFFLFRRVIWLIFFTLTSVPLSSILKKKRFSLLFFLKPGQLKVKTKHSRDESKGKVTAKIKTH